MYATEASLDEVAFSTLKKRTRAIISRSIMEMIAMNYRFSFPEFQLAVISPDFDEKFDVLSGFSIRTRQL